MSPPTLTIAIPTYGRPQFLAQTVASLLPQLVPAVNLLILDNASPTSAAEALAEVMRERTESVHIVRHPQNIGGNANITRCLELAESEWVWILGDDDPVMPGGVAAVLSLIDTAAPDVGLICCRSDSTGPLAYEPARTLGDLPSRITYDDFLFISTKILRTKAHRPHLAAAYHWCGAYCPQVALYLSALLTGSWSIAFSRAVIVHQTIQPHAARWSYLQFLLTAGSISFIGQTPAQQLQLGRWLAACQFFRPLKMLAHIALLVPERSQRAAMARMIAGTVFAHSPWTHRLFLIASPLFVWIPWLPNLASRAVLRARGKDMPVDSDRKI